MNFYAKVQIDTEDIPILEAYAKEMKMTMEQVIEYFAQDYVNKIRERWQSG